MADTKEYKIDWLEKDDLPPAGIECPKCGKGVLKDSQYYTGVYCPDCKWSWRETKFKKKEETPLEKRVAKTEEKIIKNSVPSLVREELVKILREVADFYDGAVSDKDGEWHGEDD